MNGISSALIYSVAQPVLNLLFGFLWGLIVKETPSRRPSMFWAALLVFVTVRVVGDWLFAEPHLPFESVRLYVYATCFFLGTLIPQWLRRLYGR